MICCAEGKRDTKGVSYQKTPIFKIFPKKLGFFGNLPKNPNWGFFGVLKKPQFIKLGFFRSSQKTPIGVFWEVTPIGGYDLALGLILG